MSFCFFFFCKFSFYSSFISYFLLLILPFILLFFAYIAFRKKKKKNPIEFLVGFLSLLVSINSPLQPHPKTIFRHFIAIFFKYASSLHQCFFLISIDYFHNFCVFACNEFIFLFKIVWLAFHFHFFFHLRFFFISKFEWKSNNKLLHFCRTNDKWKHPEQMSNIKTLLMRKVDQTQINWFKTGFR